MSQGYVYFIEAVGLNLIKIGWSRFDPRNRASDLSTASPAELCLLGALASARSGEKELHRRFAAHRRNGEWFEATTELRELAASAQSPIVQSEETLCKQQAVRLYPRHQRILDRLEDQLGAGPIDLTAMIRWMIERAGDEEDATVADMQRRMRLARDAKRA